MTSGIYKLTFSSGKFYIGKSINIQNRWQQHFDKFRKGKAAERMQQEFNCCGFPLPEIIYECHADHIDILETLLIHQFRNGNMLNATYAEPDPTSGAADVINQSQYWLGLGTLQHLKMMHGYEFELGEHIAEINKTKQTLQNLREQGWITTPEVRQLKRDYNLCQLQLRTAENRVHKLLTRNWWQRLINQSV